MVKLATATINKGNDGPRLDDLITLATFKDKSLQTKRLLGDMVIVATHWVTITTKEGKTARLPIPCINVDLEGNVDPDKGCAWCGVLHKARNSYYCNAIDKRAASNQPRKLPAPTKKEVRTGFKEKGSSTWTPVEVLQFPPMCAEQLQTLTFANKNKRGDVKELSDPVFGRALDIAKNPDAKSPSGIWNIQRAEEKWAKLTPEELGYLTYDLSQLSKLMISAKASEAKLRSLLPVMDPKELAELDLTGFEDVLKGGKGDDEGKKAKKSKSGAFAIEKDVEDDDDIPTRRKRSSDDDTIAPRKKKRAPERELARSSKTTKTRDATDGVRKKKKLRRA